MVSLRQAYLWLAVGLIGFAVYASLLPFELRAIPLSTVLTDFWSLVRDPFAHEISRTNFLANILLYVPVGFCLMGALLADRRSPRSAFLAPLIVLPISVAASLAAEFLQMFAPGRLPSSIDVMAQTLGCVAGIVLWAIAGSHFTEWLRATTNRSRADRVARALFGYAGAWVFVQLAPFDITLDPGELAKRYRDGLITLNPFGGHVSTYELAWDALATTIGAVPLGALGVIGATGHATRRYWPSAFAIGAALVLALELAQIVIQSHAAAGRDVLFGWLGVAIGVWIAGRMLTRRVIESTWPIASSAAFAALGAWCLVLMAYHWLPYDFAVDADAIKAKLARLSLVPFAGYQAGSDLNAFNDLLVKLGLALPFGLMSAFGLRTLPPRAAAVLLIAGAGVVFGVIEAGQFFLPTRVPDPTDVLVGVVGSLVGLSLGRWLGTGAEVRRC